jgi:glycyl-tRNA synthetase
MLAKKIPFTRRKVFTLLYELMTNLETIVARAKRKWFVYPWSDIYWWLANAWDYGPYGVQLKKNIADRRWKCFVTMRDDMIWLDSQILMHPRVREASGHVAWFNDPLIDDKRSWQRFRADKLIEEVIAEKKLNIENLKDLWVENLIPESWTFEQMKACIVKYITSHPEKKKQPVERTDVRTFNMMFFTYQWVIVHEDNKVWMRPETAQGIFVNFKNVIDTTRMRIPFGIAQIGKAFRNEITPGNFLYRTREFEQMEIEYFVENQTETGMEFFKQRKRDSQTFWFEWMKFNPEHMRFRDHEKDELSHYSAWTTDVEYAYPWGWGELQWIAYRTDFDLRQHQEISQKNLMYTDPFSGKRYLPHVIEPSFGLSRTVLATMLEFYDEEQLDNGEMRVVIRFPYALAPVKCAVFPLMEKDDTMRMQALHIVKNLRMANIDCEYDGWGNIGKRYRRQDEIGTPWCVTVDHQTLEDGTITLRDRDTMQQVRIHQDNILSSIVR